MEPHPSASRFELGCTSELDNSPGTIKQLLAVINQERGMSVSGTEVGIKSLVTTLEGIERITGRVISLSELKSISAAELKTVKRLYLVGFEHKAHLWNIIDPPHLNRPSLEFRVSASTPRNGPATEVVRALLASFAKDISSARLGMIDRSIPELPTSLLKIEKQDSAFSALLREQCHGDLVAMADAYRRLALDIEGYQPGQQSPSNLLDEAVYTYLRTLRFAHHALGFEEANKLGALPKRIVPIPEELERFCVAIGARSGTTVFPSAPIISIDTFPGFVDAWAGELLILMKQTTGLNTARAELDRITSLAQRVLNLYCYFHLGEKQTDATQLSTWDCVAAMCAIRQEQSAKTKHPPYWPSQPTQGKNILAQFMPTNRKPGRGHRRIEELYSADYVPHAINQIVYQRFCSVQSALVGTIDVHEARMSFRVARLKKYAECFRSNNVDLINGELTRFEDFCHDRAAHCVVERTDLPQLWQAVDRWLLEAPE